MGGGRPQRIKELRWRLCQVPVSCTGANCWKLFQVINCRRDLESLIAPALPGGELELPSTCRAGVGIALNLPGEELELPSTWQAGSWNRPRPIGRGVGIESLMWAQRI